MKRATDESSNDEESRSSVMDREQRAVDHHFALPSSQPGARPAGLALGGMTREPSSAMGTPPPSPGYLFNRHGQEGLSQWFSECAAARCAIRGTGPCASADTYRLRSCRVRKLKLWPAAFSQER